MKQTIKTTDSYTLASLADPKTKLFYVSITTDLHEYGVKNTAVAEIYGDMLLSGTKSKTRDEFTDALKKIGATISISISNDLCTISLKVLERHAKKATDLLFEMIEEPAFNAKELRRVVTSTKNHLAEARDNSKRAASQNLVNALFDSTDRRASSSITQLLRHVEVIKKADVQHMHKGFRNGFWYVTTAGSASVCTHVSSKIQAHKQNAITKPLEATKVTKNRKNLVLESIPSRQNIEIYIGAPVPLTHHHDEYPALTLGLAVLGMWGGFAGRLMSTVREKEGLTYGIYAKAAGVHQSETGYWQIVTFFAPDKVIQGLTSTYREIKKMHRFGITEKELQTFKTILTTKQVLANDSLGGQASRLHSYLVQGLTTEEYEQYLTRLQSVTRTEINQAVKKYLDPATLTISAAGPTAGVEKDLKLFSKSV